MAENMNKLDLTAQLEELRQVYEKGWLCESAYQAAVAGIKASQKDVPHHNCKEMTQ
jgi:hypothetical protein